MFRTNLRILTSSFRVVFRELSNSNRVTPEQVAVVKQSFDPIVKNAPAIGKIFFKRLFELYPSSQKYFKHLGSTEEELFTNPIFQSHCTKVILSVGSLIDNLHADNHSKNEELAKKLATIHAKRKVTVEQSPYIKHTLMDILHLEPHSALEKAWVNVIDALFSVYNEKLETAWKSKP